MTPITLTGDGLTATFIPAAGMVCTSLTHRGDELLGQSGGCFAWRGDGPVLLVGGAPGSCRS